MSPFSRRGLMAGAAAMTLAGCGPDLFTAKPKTIEDAVAGDWRPEADKARDKFRHPVQTLNFFGLKQAMTVVEFWPGAGWYTDILAPFLAATGGKLYAANVEPLDDVRRQAVEAYKKKLAARRRLYGAVSVTAFGVTSGPVAPPGSADLALFFRNIHNWMAAGIADKAFADAFAALKPGGVLGVVEHRADPAMVQDAAAASGYVQQDYVIELAREAGFALDARSEINANPKDTKDHPFGVWTLPP
ncbi:MAG TPA: methyltransferase, partial [Caulobacteraceae bacterium]